MSERGQKIFKIITWVAICIFAIFSIGKIIYYTNNPLITKTQWVQMLADSFQIEDTTAIDDGGTDKASGEYAALTLMKTIGDSNIEFMTGEDNLDEDGLVKLAVEKDIVSKRQLSHSLTEADAKEIIDNAMSFYFNLDNYPEYYDVVYSCDVVNTDEWIIDNFDEDNDVLYVSKLEILPERGQVVLPRNVFGIAKPRYVKECKELEDGTYEILLEKMSDPSELYNDISFSGKADFSYLLNASEGGSADTEETTPTDTNEGSSTDTEETAPTDTNETSDSFGMGLFEPKVVYAATEKTFVAKADLETGGTIAAKAKDNGSTVYSYNSYLKVKDGENESKYSITADSKGKLKLEVARNDVTLEAEHEAENAAKDDKFEAEASATDSFSYKVKLNDLQIAAAYCATGGKADKYVDVRVNSDAELDWSIKGKFEGKVPIAEVEVPVYCTFGLASVNLRLYLVVDASGEVTLIYEMDDVSLGVRVDQKGLSIPHDRNESGDKLDITAKVSVGIGLSGEVALTIGDWLDLVEYDIVDPGVDVKIEALAETLQNNEGFEDYPQCVQVTIAAPTVSFEISAGEDSLLYTLLDLFNLSAKASYDFITEENAPFKKEYHIETELDGSSNTIEGSKDYCTHVLPEAGEEWVDPLVAAKKRAQEEARKRKEEARKKAQEEFEKALEEAIERWIDENCGGC